MKDYGTKPVEAAWIAPFRKYAPAILVFCVAVLLLLALVPVYRGRLHALSIRDAALLVLVFGALAALVTYLFVTAKQLETTQQTEMESAQEVYELSERLNTTLRSIGDGVISTDVDGVVTLMNDVAVQLTGYPQAKAIGMRAADLFQLIHEKTRQPEENPARIVLASGRRIREDARAILVSRDGTEHPIAYNAAPILDADGWMMGAVIVFHDVAELRAIERQREDLIRELSQTNERLRDEVGKREAARRAALNLMQDAQQAQADLRESQERLRVLFQGIDDALFVHDPDGKLLDCNQAACARLGYTREELLALTVSAIRRETTDDPTQWFTTRDGREIPVHVHTSVIKYHGADSFLTVARDITELRQAQDELRARNEQLRETNASLEEYARVASHDLQEPLRKIESFAQVLTEDYGRTLDAKGRQYLGIMVGSANRMRRLIRDVLAFSRAGTSQKPFAPVDLNHILSIVRDNLSQRIQERSAEVVVKPLPTVVGDETQMVQLFQNLVGNGLKFNDKERPRVEVYAEEDRDEWNIFVKDNGIGMRTQESQMIFAPFKRLHTQDQYEGTGIGLAICRRIVSRHGGQISVESEPGRGSTFSMTLPKMTIRLHEDIKEQAKPERQKGEHHEPDNR